MRQRSRASSHKKAVLLLLNRENIMGYVNVNALGREKAVDLLTPQGEHKSINLEDIKSVYFVKEFHEPYELERKSFLSRPKLDGLWVRLKFSDDDVLEGIVANDLVDLLDSGVRLTPPDIHGNTLRMFVPRTALVEMKVLGVVGVARRPQPRAEKLPESQPNLFGE